MAIIANDVASVITILEGQIKDMFASESSGHDIYHLERTMNLALHIQEKEGGDRFVIAIASFLHDIHRIMQNKTGKYCTPAQSLSTVRELLWRSVLGHSAQIKRILSCIKHHEEYDFSDAGKTAKDIETLILQDADNLDAIGAVGIARVFSFGGAHGIPIWVPEIPLDAKSAWDETKPKSPSQIQHFHEKLLRLKDNMNTATAKRMAEGRHRFMENYLAKFFQEWEGVV